MSRKRGDPKATLDPFGGSLPAPNWADPLVWTTAAWNQTASQFFLFQLMSIAMARYRWVDLPPKVDVRFLERTLLLSGEATITWPTGFPPANAFAMQAVEGTPDGNLEQTAWRAIGANGKGWPVTTVNGVMVYDSQLRVPRLGFLNFIAAECANIMRTKQTVRQHMRQPVLITAPREQAQQLHNLTAQIANGEPYILGYDRFLSDMETSVLKVASDREDMQLPALQADLKDVWNLGLAYLGIGVAERKAERQSVPEIQQADEPTSLAALDGLMCRRKACDQLNELTGGHASVFWNQDVESATFNALNNLETQLESPGQPIGADMDDEEEMPDDQQ